jgi:hypothetical protein
MNRGTGQGKCCSPLLFDNYIDDLLDDLEKYCEAVYAFADDIGTHSEDLTQLNDSMNCINDWPAVNHIEVNHKKSGVLVIDDDGATTYTINEYPVIYYYKYLGILIDVKMNPKKHLMKLNEKLNDYLKRNHMLHKSTSHLIA